MHALILLPEWDCGACTSMQQAMRGCEKPATSRLDFLGERLTRCPRRPVLDDGEFYSELFYLYGTYKSGMLPEGNSLGSNPNKLVEAIRLVGDAIASAERERDEGERRKRARRDRYAMMAPPVAG